MLVWGFRGTGFHGTGSPCATRVLSASGWHTHAHLILPLTTEAHVVKKSKAAMIVLCNATRPTVLNLIPLRFRSTLKVQGN